MQLEFNLLINICDFSFSSRFQIAPIDSHLMKDALIHSLIYPPQFGDMQVWTRAILPSGSFAFAFMNKATAVPSVFSIQLSAMGFNSPGGYNVTEVFDNQFIGILKPTDTIKVSVNPTGVFFGQAVKL